MHNDHPTIEAVLGTLSGGGQPPPRGLTKKLEAVQVGSPESFYMLATYCFDLSRKLEYLSKVSLPYAEHIPQEIAQEMLEDTKRISAADVPWEERAKAAEEIMLRLHEEIGAEAKRALERAAYQEAR
jgi:hypothetical protein